MQTSLINYSQSCLYNANITKIYYVNVLTIIFTFQWGQASL